MRTERTPSIREAVDDFLDHKEYQGVIRRWLLGHRHVSGAILATYDRILRVTFNGFEKRSYIAASPMANLPKRIRRGPSSTRSTAPNCGRSSASRWRREAVWDRVPERPPGPRDVRRGAGDRTPPHADGGREAAESSVTC